MLRNNIGGTENPATGLPSRRKKNKRKFDRVNVRGGSHSKRSTYKFSSDTANGILLVRVFRDFIGDRPRACSAAVCKALGR
jgi:hypothetical protein